MMSSQTFRTFGALLMAIGLVFAGISGAVSLAQTPVGDSIEDTTGVDTASLAPAGPVEACGGICIGAVAVGAAAAGTAAGAWLNGGVDREDVEEVIDAEIKQQRIDLSQSARATQQGADTFITQQNNTITDSRAIASQKAKAKLARMLNNGTTDPQTLSNAVNQTIDDYYSRTQQTLLVQQRAHLAQMAYIRNTTNADVDMDSILRMENLKQDTYEGFLSSPGDSFPKKEMTLVNGSSTTRRAVVAQAQDGSYLYTLDWSGVYGNYYWESASINSSNYLTSLGSRASFGAEFAMNAKAISTSNDSLKAQPESIVYRDFQYAKLWVEMDEAATQMKNNYDLNYVDSVAAQYQAGEIESSDLVSPEVLANEWGTSYNQTGDSIYKWANYVALGLEAPDLNKTDSITVQYNRDPDIRTVKLEATTAGSETPLNATLTFPDGNQTKRTLVDENGTSTPATLEIPESDGPAYKDIDISFTTPSSGTTVPFSPDGTTTSVGDHTVTQSTVTSKQVTERGLLFAPNAPAEWESGTTYSTNNLGTVYFARTEAPLGDEIVPVDGSFTVQNITTESGAQVDNITTRNYNKQTADASEFVNQTQNAKKVRVVVETNEPDLSGGGGLFGGFSLFGLPGPMVLVLIGGAVYLFGRD